MQLINDYDKLKGYDAEVVLISPSDEKKTKEFLKIAEDKLSLKIPFPVLIDSERQVVKVYGVLGDKAIPSTFVIDKKGVLRFKYIGQDATDRPPTEHLIEMLEIASQEQSNPPTSAADMKPAKSKQELNSIIDKHMKSLGIERPQGVKLTNFTLKTLNDRDVSLSDYRGKIVFLNFWATWCPPCRQEIPSMEKLYQKFKDKDFVILAASLREKAKTVKKFVKDYKLTFPVLLDSKGKVGSAYLVTSIPTTYLINRQGEIIGRALGGRKWAGEDSFNLFSALLKFPLKHKLIFRNNVKED